ncbi:hypothetical protein DV736_g3200, partial [Chaetothyriales sp. CBS 134916]
MARGASKRKFSQSTLSVPEKPRNVRERSASPAPGPSGIATIATAVKGLFSSQPDPSNPVIAGASDSLAPTPFIGNFFKGMASQASRIGENANLLSSFVNSELFYGGYVDDRKYQMEQIIQLAASLPEGNGALNQLTGKFIKLLWNSLEHPPLSYQGNEYKYRMADGSNNNVMYPHLGKAGSYYARTVNPQTLQLGVLPDPGVVFDAVFAARKERREHPNRISSMLFYLASIIIHDCFHTDESDSAIVKTSSYLDLSPLYGSSEEDQAKIRTFKDGLLKPDTFSNPRILGFPPGVAALVICFNRFHNYVAIQLKAINQDGRFSVSSRIRDPAAAQKKVDEDLFQTARLVTCGLYINIILIDYVRTILNLNRTNSTWTLDPRANVDVFGAEGLPSGIGNQVSVEFNLLYRWHSAISKKDEQWTNELYEKIFGTRPSEDVDEATFGIKLYQWLAKQGDDPSKWALDAGKYRRNSRGCFHDEDLCNILSNATEDVAGAFGPRNVPIAMKLIETMGIKQARAWNVATLNELRKFFKLDPHKTFSEITRDETTAHALKALYGHPDYVEMYPGLVAEDAKSPLDPGSGLCLGYTTSRAILADAVALSRGDRFYTVDSTPAILTNWGFNQIRSDPGVAQGHCIYNLLMRALPNYYRGNSVYAMFPFTVPQENLLIHKKLGVEKEYYYERPSFVPIPKSIKTWQGITSVLNDHNRFGVPWGLHTRYLTGHDYMLSGDKPWNFQQKQKVGEAMYGNAFPKPTDVQASRLAEVQKFYEDLTTQLVIIRSQALFDNVYQLDACRDVGNPSHAIFTAKIFHLPLVAPDDINPVGVTVDNLYLAMSVLFAYVFLDLDTARSFKLRSGAKTSADGIAKLVRIVVEAVKADSYLHLSDLFRMGRSGKVLGDYGTRLIRRLLDSGGSVDDVVWTIIPTCAAAIATQAQHFTLMLDLYLSDEYKKHWPDIQACAWSNKAEDFDKLKSYALEANRLAPAAYGLLRTCQVNSTIDDRGKKVSVKAGEQVYTDFISAGLDPKVFPNPKEIKLDRKRDLYIHHGHGQHACLGRPIVEVAMAAQLKVFAKLKNLKRAPGLQGELKKTSPTPNPVSSDPKPSPGRIDVFMKEDWSDWWPFPTTLKIHHEGFYESQENALDDDTGVPNLQQDISFSDMMQNGINGHADSTA